MIGGVVAALLVGAAGERALSGHVSWAPASVEVRVSPSPLPVPSASPSPYFVPVPAPTRTVLVPAQATFDCESFARDAVNDFVFGSVTDNLPSITEQFALHDELVRVCQQDGGQ